jgi:N6-L-threonylcarbamoyladenine synthase
MIPSRKRATCNKNLPRFLLTARHPRKISTCPCLPPSSLSPPSFPVPVILAIESSCDETAVAILRGEPGESAHILASEISSQIPLHQPYGGVVPELASRNHSLILRPLVETTLQHAGITIQQIDAFAATAGPGLASSLLIGNTAAKAMACALRKPYLAINHLEGHLLSPFVASSTVPPHIALIISGGHTLLLRVHAPARYQKLGSTLDDAAGEAFDKVAKMLGLPYPGGPNIERTALTGDPTRFAFPRGLLHEPHYDFSFSGLKTSVLYTLPKIDNPTAALPDLCASFQQAVIDVLLQKSLRAVKESGLTHLALSGGVSLNRALRQAFQNACDREGYQLSLSDPALCTDNAAMIAFAGLLRHLDGQHDSLQSPIHPNLPLTERGL